MGFKPKGCSVERDVVLAMRNDHYDVMIFPDHFPRGDVSTNAVLRELAEMHSEDRRHPVLCGDGEKYEIQQPVAGIPTQRGSGTQ